MAGPLELAGERPGVRGVVVLPVAGLGDALQLGTGLARHLEADGIDVQIDAGGGELGGDLAGRRRPAVVLAVGDQQDRALADRAAGGPGQIGGRLAQGEPDGGVALGLDARDGPLDARPVEGGDRLGEPGVVTALGLVGAVDPQTGGVAVGECVDDRADGLACGVDPGAAGAVLPGHRAG